MGVDSPRWEPGASLAQTARRPKHGLILVIAKKDHSRVDIQASKVSGRKGIGFRSSQ